MASAFKREGRRAYTVKFSAKGRFETVRGYADHLRSALPDLRVFTVGVGDTIAPEDVRIDDAEYSPVVRVPSRAVIRAGIRRGDMTPLAASRDLLRILRRDAQ